MIQKLHLVMGSDTTFNPKLTYLFINRDECCASDAHSLVIHKCDKIFEQSFIDSIPEGDWLIPKDAVKKMNTKGATYLIKSEQIHITIKGEVTIFPILKDGVEFTFPQYRDVIPYEFKGELNIFGVDPQRLLNIALAINPEYAFVHVQFNSAISALNIRVANSYDLEYTAILMPMLVQ